MINYCRIKTLKPTVLELGTQGIQKNIIGVVALVENLVFFKIGRAHSYEQST